MCTTPKGNMINKAIKLSNMTYSLIEKKNCKKLLIGKTFWKSVALPLILYGAKNIDMTESEINKLQRIENGVYRNILGAPEFVSICTLRGDTGSSLMKERVISGRIQYLEGITEGNNNRLKRMLEEIMRIRVTWWMRITLRYMNETNVKSSHKAKLSKEKLEENMKAWDAREWKQELKTKTTLHIYKTFKEAIKEEEV